MSEKHAYLLPPADELALLSNETAANSLNVLDSAHQREYFYASLAMICGTLGLLACIATFAYPVTATRKPLESSWVSASSPSSARSSIPG